MLRVAQGAYCRRWDGFAYWTWRSLIGVAFVFGLLASALRFTYDDIGVVCVVVMVLLIRGRVNRQLDRQLLVAVVTNSSGEQQRHNALVSVVGRASGWMRRHAKRILRKEKLGQDILAVAGRTTARRDIDKVLLRAGNQPIPAPARKTLLQRIRNFDLQLDAISTRVQICVSLFATGPLTIFYHALLVEMRELFEEVEGVDLSLFNGFISGKPVWLCVKILVAVLLLGPVIFLAIRAIAPGLLRLPPLSLIHRKIARSLTLTTFSQLVATTDTLNAINATRDIVESKSERRTLEAFRQLVSDGMQLPEAAFKSGLLPSNLRTQTVTSNTLRLFDNAAVVFADRLIRNLRLLASIVVVGYTLLVSAALIAHGLVFVHAIAEIIEALG
ncbi:MAG: hypothetical protein Aurels2KO_45200 [Aureliella sp.]